MTESWKSTLGRWFTVNRADTREPGGPPGGRYAGSFARVWDEILSYAAAQPRWQKVHGDETNGIMTVACRSRVFGFVDDLTIWVSLDDQGFTCVEARSRARTGKGDFGVNRRRIEGLITHLDEAFGRV